MLTSSFAAIGYTPKPGAEFTEDDWTDPGMPGLPPYPRSKTIAERAAWDFMRAEGGGVSDHPPMTYLEFAGFLRERFGALAAKAPTEQAPGDDLPPMVIRNDRARDELGWRPRPVEATVADTVQSLVERGELPGP